MHDKCHVVQCEIGFGFWKKNTIFVFFEVCHFFVCLVVVFPIGILGAHCEELPTPCTGKSSDLGNHQ